MSKLNSVNLGLIGSGYMALTYAEAIHSHVKGGHLVAIAGGSRAAGLAADYGVTAEPTIEALLARPDIDAVILTTPDQVHHPETLQAAAAGKHVLVEKPMAPSVAQCREMIAACRAAGVKLAVVKTERYRRLTRQAKQLIEAGQIGSIRMLRTVSCFPISLGQEILESRPWYGDPAGGGLFMSMASHNADMLLWLNGVRVVQVFAQGTTFSDISLPAQSVMAQLRFENGSMGQMLISAEMPPPSLRSSEVRFEVIGSQGMLDFENYEFLDLGKGTGWERLFIPERFDYLAEPKSPIRLEPHIGVVQEFVNSILEDRPPQVSGADGLAAVEICEACLRSARSGQAVSLPWED
jgi:UDP-N-acetyl-2-amino-2-deoxyglucuronate dehydrogenase